jgi:hypothetical protein
MVARPALLIGPSFFHRDDGLRGARRFPHPSAAAPRAFRNSLPSSALPRQAVVLTTGAGLRGRRAISPHYPAGGRCLTRHLAALRETADRVGMPGARHAST